MNRTFFLKAASVATLSVAAIATTATDAQAQSELNFEGSALVRDQPGSGGANLLIDFLVGGSTSGTPIGTVEAIETIGSEFAGVAVGDEGTITDLVANNSGFVGLPVNPLLTIGGYTFTLTGSPSGNTFGPISLFDIGTGTIATFGVNGTVTGGSFGTSMRSFQGAFSAQFAGESPEEVFDAINVGGTRAVSFSAEFVVAPQQVIPEPSTYALLATGIGALGLVARRRRTQA